MLSFYSTVSGKRIAGKSAGVSKAFKKVNMSQKAEFVRPPMSAVLFDCFFEVPGASSS